MAASASALPPIPRTRLIGREAERSAARTFLLAEAVPLLTVTGPGGVGKTRLALAVADEAAGSFGDGVVWVDLASLADPALVPAAVAMAVGLTPAPDQPVAGELTRVLRPQQILLLLDNCEHLLAATADLVAALLGACPALQVLATSRAPLRVRGEQLLPVPPMAQPDPADPPSLAALAQSEAVALFVARARAADPGFALTEANAAAVAGVCARLDGLPLAIELAAARLRALSVETLQALLGDRLLVLTGGERDRPDRQRTLRATVAWSHDLLAPAERVLYRRLAVFVGGFSPEGAQAVAGGDSVAVLDGLQALADQALVAEARAAGGWTRYGMLETVHDDAAERLAASGEERRVRAAHAAHVLAVAERLDLRPTDPESPDRLDRLEAERGNARAALAWFAERGEATPLLRLAAALGGIWTLRGPHAEGREWLERALAAGPDAPPLLRAKAATALAWLALYAGDDARAAALADEALGIARAGGDPELTAVALFMLGAVDRRAGAWERATARYERAIELMRPLGGARLVAGSLGNLARIDMARGDAAAASRRLEEALVLQEGNGDVWRLFTLVHLAEVRRAQGDRAAAARFYRASLDLCVGAGATVELVDALHGLAALASDAGRVAAAARLSGAAVALEDGAGGRKPAPSGSDRPGPDPTFAAGAPLGLDEAVAEARALADALAAPISPAAAGPEQSSSPKAPTAFDLTRREREVLALLCQRLTDPEIAARLFVSPRTASFHVANVLGKLGAANRRDAVGIAARHRLI